MIPISPALTLAIGLLLSAIGNAYQHARYLHLQQTYLQMQLMGKVQEEHNNEIIRKNNLASSAAVDGYRRDLYDLHHRIVDKRVLDNTVAGTSKVPTHQFTSGRADDSATGCTTVARTAEESERTIAAYRTTVAQLLADTAQLEQLQTFDRERATETTNEPATE